MRAYIKKESGFTLIEALVAFLIIVVGLAGAALFQSELITESGASKSRAVAIALAEKELEEQRALLTDTQYADLETIVSGAVPVVHAVTVGNAVYDVSFSATKVSSGATEAHYLFTASVDWDDAKGDADSVSLSTLLSDNRPENSLDNSEQAGSTGSNPNVGQIERPSGAAVAIARVTTEEAKTDTAIGDYVELGDEKFGIKVGECDGESCDIVVSVIRRTNTGSPIFKITGDIYLASDNTTFDTLVNVSPNVLTSEGGGCAIYKDGDQPKYTCLFGEGWYGTISLLLNDGSSGHTNTDVVCNSPRAYKYYIVDPEKVTSGGIDTAFIGQSGLVRFTTSAGAGPYLTDPVDYETPGLGYYYVYDEVVSGATDTATDTANTSGNIYNQHYAVVDKHVSCDSDPFFEIMVDRGDGSLIPSAYPNATYDYEFTATSTAKATVIPSGNIIMGYVNKAYEIAGSVDVTGATGTANDLKDSLQVGITPLPSFAQDCNLEVTGDQTLQYTCYVDYNWSGTVEMAFATGTTLSVSSPAIEKYVFNDSGLSNTYPRVTTDVVDKDFIVIDTAP